MTDFTRGYPTREAALKAVDEFRSAVATAEVADFTGTDLVTFLRARLDEREQLARAASEAPSDPGTIMDLPPRGPWAEFDAANDPAYVLADIAAKRAILDLWVDPVDVRDWPKDVCDGRDPDEVEAQVAAAEEIDWVVRLLAASFRDHPGWDPAWDVT